MEILKSMQLKHNSRIIILIDTREYPITRTFHFSLIRRTIHITRDIETADGTIDMIDMIDMMTETDIGVTIN